MLNYLASISENLHSLCVERTSKSDYPHIYKAMMCGASFPRNNEIYDMISRLGLIHLIVISGLHVSVIENLLNKIFKKVPGGDLITMTILFLFGLVCRFNPPILRALIYKFTQLLNPKIFSQISPPTQIFITCITGVLLFPELAGSKSYQLSCLATQTISLTQNKFWQPILIYILLLPLLMTLGTPSPFSILIQYLVSAPLLFIFFMSSLLVLIYPTSSIITDLIISKFLIFLKVVSSILPFPLKPIFNYSNQWIWLWIIIIYVIGLLCHVFRTRKKLYSTF